LGTFRDSGRGLRDDGVVVAAVVLGDPAHSG
jgi:hypothetical protein